MKSFPNPSPKPRVHLAGVIAAILAFGWTFSARGALSSWIRNIEGGTPIERAFFRLMPLPGGDVLFRRPPAETRPALTELIQQQPNDADLFSMRALEDEQQLDFLAAETDWKRYAETARDRSAAQIALADFYHRRLRPQEEIAALSVVAEASATSREKLAPPEEQQSWRAFERIFGVLRAQGSDKELWIAEYRKWLLRYPDQPQLYARFLDYLIAQKEFPAANQLIDSYRKKFPGDDIFFIKAKALVEYRQGSLQEGLAVYEKSFQPLWAPELVKGYFDLLAQTQNLRKFLDQSRAALASNPQDLAATARVFYYYQQQGKLDTAQQAIADFRSHKEASKAQWTPEELYVCARLLEEIHSYPEAARYYFALYNSPGSNDSQSRALAGLTNLLLTAPEAPIRLGSGDLSLYKDIATLDRGPGYFNGILSLILNTTNPPSAFSEEEQRAVPYFHRARAAELLALLDKNFPNSLDRPELHAKLLEFYANSGQSAAVLKSGKEFLAAFPNASQRTRVALLIADADARLNRTQDEFAIYDSVLRELAIQSENMPLGAGAFNSDSFRGPQTVQGQNEPEPNGDIEPETEMGFRRPQVARQSAFELNLLPTVPQTSARSAEYARVLERYLARLVQLKQVPQALAVLRREIDHNPDDPGLYERLAVFLDQNHLETEQEEVYRRAMARFPDRSWYHKLARYYLRRKKNAEFEDLTQEAIKQFDGSDLETYFKSVVVGTPQMYLRLNQYASARFPHNPVFIRNLLATYRAQPTWNPTAWEALLRQHWFEESDLRNQFFEFLSSTNRLDGELTALTKSVTLPTNNPSADFVRENPAAGNLLAQASLWKSHFEDSAPILKALADQYPADAELVDTASSVYRSLAYSDPAKTGVAVKLQENLLAANPGNTEILARIGDIYADRELFRQAAPYWERIPKVAPGNSGGYLEAATIYWDYFDFDDALRLLQEGRKKLHDDRLYGYEAGAIYEGKRDYSNAIHEYTLAAVEAAESPAAYRLVDLARRPKFREAIDHEAAKLNVSPQLSLPAVLLRIRVLETQNRKPELADFLQATLQKATTIEQAAEIENLAQQKSLEQIRELALEKQAALATDPVTRLQLRYALVRLYETRKEISSAQRTIETLYRENPKILGVVRSTVDFDWRNKLYPQAISVLRQAAKDSYPEQSKQFTFEAARKSTEARQFQQARDLLEPLLKDSPYDSQVLAALADTYAQAGDQQGLKNFYLTKIAQFRNAPLSSDDRKAKLAALRRGLIPALTQLNDYSGSVDQYIELINAYPEDEGLVSEASLCALRYQRQAQLLDFYSKTAQQSPRDYRWPMVVARVHATFEDFPAAIDAYGKSLAIRPDRTDLRIARAALLERLLRFDEAASDYERLYQLAYKDPKWMEKVAEIRARQGRGNEAVSALKAALIDPAPERTHNYFEVARRLEGWGILEQARGFAEQGVNLAGTDLLASADYHGDAKTFVRILTRLRQQETAYSALQKALADASSALPVLKEQVAREGIAAITDREFRDRSLQMRIANARDGMAAALTAMGDTVRLYFTPEEKVSFAKFAENIRSRMNFQDLNALAVPLAHSAGLAELEARWRYELMMNAPEKEPFLLTQMAGFIELQRQRLKFAELGSQLERFAPRVNPMQRSTIYTDAAAAFRAAGDPGNELRMLSKVSPEYRGGDVQQRFFGLLLMQRPQELVEIASAWTRWGQEAADFMIANGDASLAHAVLAARGHQRPPVWTASYTALVGLYFAETAPPIGTAFLDALGDQTIGERIGKPVNRDNQLAGNIWFYYGSRYGEYLSLTKQSSADDFVPAILEQSPASAAGYETVADYYADKADVRSAIADYSHALDLAPDRPDLRDRLALAHFRQGDRTEALSQWRLALDILLRQANSGRFPESFWRDFGRVCDHLHSRHLFDSVKPDADAVMRAYLRRNGNYRSNALLHAAFSAIDDPAAATAWLLDVSSSAPDPVSILADVADAKWIPMTNRSAIFRRILATKQNAVATSEGVERESAENDLRSWQLRWANYLIGAKQFTEAGEFLASLPKETRDANSAAIVPLELRIAAQIGTLDSKINAYRSDLQNSPPAEVLRGAARQLFEAGDKQSARKILEFVFAREIDQHQLAAANFLGLSEVRLAAGDTPAALELLHRLVLVVGEPYLNMDAAAALLEKTGHAAESIEFLEPLVKTTPWEPSLRLRLAKARIAARRETASAQADLTTIASSTDVPYVLRTEAAQNLSNTGHPSDFGSLELRLLVANPRNIAAGSADQPFFYEARLRAAENLSGSMRLQLLASALSDTPVREDARIPLFYAAVSIHSDELALAAIGQLLRDSRFRQTARSSFTDEESMLSSEEGGDQPQDVPVYAISKLDAAGQAQLLRAVAGALIRANRLSESLPYLQLAHRVEKDSSRNREISALIADVKTRLRRQQLNSARQPVLHDALEQDRIVRPRLLARAPMSEKSEMREKP